jgi:hypothetical protein
MNLTPNVKRHIDGMDYEQLLAKWRFAEFGDALFEGASGDYFKSRMVELRDSHPDPVGVSKRIGWK